MIKSDSECEFGKFCAVVLLAHFIKNNNKRNRTQKPEIQGGRRKLKTGRKKLRVETGIMSVHITLSFLALSLLFTLTLSIYIE